MILEDIVVANSMTRQLLVLGLVLCSTTGFGADWPKFRGPNGDGISTETGLLKQWPQGGPPLVWEVEGLGDGYSSAAIADGSVYVTGFIEGEGYVFAFDLDGKPRWKICYGPEWTRSYKATRGTPTIEDDRLYVSSGLGAVYCLNTESGDVVWSLEMEPKYKIEYPRWGMSENLLVDGGRLICTPGGEVASVIALDKRTGDVVWECRDVTEQSAYCNPRVFERGGRRIIVTMLADSVVGLDAETGKLLWRDPFDDYHSDRRRIVNANTPIYHEGRIYTTSGYNNGGAMLQLSDDGTQIERIWTDTVLDTHHGGVILIDGYLYGSNWTNNSRGDWACLRWDDGKEMCTWKWNGNKGSLIWAEGLFYCYDERSGHVGLIKASPEGFDLVSQFEVTKGDGPFWAHPSISDGRLYIRHGEFLQVHDIREK